MPHAKGLQSIADYGRAPDARDPAQQGAAIDPLFDLTETESWYWSNTTHLDGPTAGYTVYVAFGQAHGVLGGDLVNVHGAAARRSDPRSGNPADWARGHGPQDDQIRIQNDARCVRSGETAPTTDTDGPDERRLEASSSEDPQQPASAGPPPEAIDACSTAKQGDACELTAPHGTVVGTSRSESGKTPAFPLTTLGNCGILASDI